MRIQIEDNSAALTPFGSLLSGVVRSKTDAKTWIIALADRSDRQCSPNLLPAALLTTAMIVIILFGGAQYSLETTYFRQSNATSSEVTSHNLLPMPFDHR
jgi:hypothetical protein